MRTYIHIVCLCVFNMMELLKNLIGWEKFSFSCVHNIVKAFNIHSEFLLRHACLKLTFIMLNISHNMYTYKYTAVIPMGK